MKFKFVLTLSLLIGLLFMFSLQAEADTSIRVGLALNTASTQNFSVNENYLLLDRYSGLTLATLYPDQNWQVVCAGGKISVFQDGKAVLSSNNPLLCCPVRMGKNFTTNSLPVTDVSSNNMYSLIMFLTDPDNSQNNGSDQSGIFTLNSSQYRGNLEFQGSNLGLTVINELNLEDYLNSVVPNEMPASWPLEALKTQAVASRSYVLYHKQRASYAASGFDILSTQQSQAYQGIGRENPQTTLAVSQTAGQILQYNGNIIETVFHSSNGGYTEASGDIWTSDLPYLQAGVDPYDANEAHYNWFKACNLEELAAKYELVKITDVSIESYTRSGGRVKGLVLTGEDSNQQIVTSTISGAEKIRKDFALSSAVFTVQKEFNEEGNLVAVTLVGNGFGHGLGLSQYGACNRAKAGQSYQQILDFYYPNCQLTNQVKNYG